MDIGDNIEENNNEDIEVNNTGILQEIGILDPEGINLNPLNNQPYSETYKKLALYWSALPAYAKSYEAISMIKENRVCVIASGTGSGKTVLIPKYALHALNYKGKVAVVLPKQIITEEAASYSARTLDVDLGKEVGFSHRAEKKYDRKLTQLLYTTDGTLVLKLMSNPYLEEFSAVIIDEAHERRVQTDFLLYLLKNLCKKREDFKLIIMSATIDKTVFLNYFSELETSYLNISGKTNFPVSRIFSKELINKTNYIKAGLERIKQIINTTSDGDILFFVPSISEAFSVCKEVGDKNNFCVEFFSGMKADKSELAIDKELYKTKLGKKRKIIIATNVAESSLTVDGIKYVIDTGYENYSYYDPKLDSKVIDKRMSSQSQIKQRCGRTGRTCYGICYHLYRNLEYDKLDAYPKPAIQTENISGETLKMMNFKNVGTVDNVREIYSKFIEPPPKIYIDAAVKSLESLGLIKNDILTEFGNIIANFPLEPNQAISIFTAWFLGCSKQVLIIILFMEQIKFKIDDIFDFNKNETKKDVLEKYETAKKSFFKYNSDHLSLLWIFVEYKNIKKENSDELKIWAKSKYLKLNILEKIDRYYQKSRGEIFAKIEDLDKNYDIKNKIKIDSKIRNLSDHKRIMLSILKGYPTNIAFNDKYGYRTKNINTVFISRDSWIKNTEARIIIYGECITMNDRTNLQIISKVFDEDLEMIKNISFI